MVRKESHQLVDTVERLLEELLQVSQIAKAQLVVVHLSWEGCSAWISEMPMVLAQLEQSHNIFLLKLPWRSEGGQFALDYRFRITAVYRVFEELVLGKLQRLAGFQEVETFPTPPWDRPHFPQLFLIDNREINQSNLQRLQEIHAKGGLVNSGNEVKLFLKEAQPDTPDFAVRDLLRNVLSGEGVLFQMLNEHLFQIDDQLLRKEELVETVECATRYLTSRSQSSICVQYMGRYIAKRIWRG